MSKIGVGIIGLSAGGGWASIAHFPYLSQSDKYEIVALTNSSIESGRKAITSLQLHNAKPYAAVEEMVKDPRVDLVVCAVAVFSHYDLIKPALLARKDVYAEWPLDITTERAMELASLAVEMKVKTIIGLQGRASPLVSTLQRLLKKEDRIGRILVSQMSGSATTGETGVRLSTRYAYFKDREVKGATGQVMLTIYAGHTIDAMAEVVGQPSTVSAGLKTTWPRVDIVDADDKVVEEDVEKTADDYATLQGVLGDNAQYSYALRGGDAFTAEEGFAWDIIGDRGQIRVTGPTIMLNMGSPAYKVRVKDYASGEITAITLDSPLNLPLTAQNVGRLYEDYADGKAVPTFADAVKRHRFIDAMFRAAETGVPVDVAA